MRKNFIYSAFIFFISSCFSGGENSSGTSLGGSSGNEEDENNTNTTLTIISVSPTQGDVLGGTVLTVVGTNFSSGMTVDVGSGSCTTVNIVSDTELTCLTPAGSTGSFSVTVFDENQLSASLANAFTYGNPSPTFSSIDPTGYITTQSETVTITGTGFIGSGPSMTSVTIGGQTCSSVIVLSGAELVCSTPTSGVSAGPANIVISNGSDSVTETGAFTFRVAPTFSELNGSGGNAIFTNSCGGCHLNGSSQGGIALDDYNDVFMNGDSGNPGVVANDPSSSWVLTRMRDQNNPMPQAGVLSSSEIQLVEDWILDGAQNN